MSRWRLILRSLLHHWRLNVAVGLGVAAGTAVLTGALLVGDSVRGSLRRLTLDRLGQIDAVLVTDRFFRSQLAQEVAAHEEFKRHYDKVVPAILLRASLDRPPRPEEPIDDVHRAGKVNLIGATSDFWKFSTAARKQPELAAGQIVLNQPLAKELSARRGDEVILRLARRSEIPSDSPLGAKSDTLESKRLTVSEIIPAEGLGRFGLSPSQQLPYNAYVAVETLQDVLEQPGRVNALLVSGKTPTEPPGTEAEQALTASLRPTMSDYGLKLAQSKRGYFQITSERMLLKNAVKDAALEKFANRGAQCVLTYLANTIRGGEGEIPYSTVTAVDFTDKPPLGPLVDEDGQPIGPLADGEIVLNSWAAGRLDMKPGAEISLEFFEPESTHGEIREQSVKLRLKAIAQLSGAAEDADLAPALKGITDQLEMDDWEPPFPFDATRIGRDDVENYEDEDYWERYRTTPKAFLSLATGRKLWANRFGDATSVRFAGDNADDDTASLEKRFQLDPAALGFVFQSVKRQGLIAATGTTSFSGLFVGFSFFIIAAAMMLVSLLFRLGIEQRTAEIGLLSAVGMRRKSIGRILAVEGLCIAADGGLLGVAAGVGYAWLMLAGLRTWWLAAITTPFLTLSVNPVSLVIGYASGVIVSFLTIVWSLRQMRNTSVRRLLAGQASEESSLTVRPPRTSRIVAAVSILGALVLVGVAFSASGEAQAGAFFGSGALTLISLLAWLWARLKSGGTRSMASAGRGALGRLAFRNGARNPGRSTLTVGLVASASFLIVALSAFRRDPPGDDPPLESGAGGFALVAESDLPIYHDLATLDGRTELGFGSDDEPLLKNVEFISLGVRPGDDASCLNLYDARMPRVLAVPQRLVRHGGFLWGATAAETTAERENPWLLLDKDLGTTPEGKPVIPVVIDRDTAMYSLHLMGGIGQRYMLPDGAGGEHTLEVVGLLIGSIFSGDLLIGERAFRQNFPDISGNRFFLVATEPDKLNEVAGVLEKRLSGYGFDAERGSVRLASFLAVQNTYLSTFQSLGGLGLLLGTFGLATVQLRNVLERRRELALLRATGFRRSSLAWLVMYENLLLLTGGVAIGVVAALVAIAPHWATGGASVPWLSLVVTLGVVLMVGIVAGLAAVRATLRADLIPALRGD